MSTTPTLPLPSYRPMDTTIAQSYFPTLSCPIRVAYMVYVGDQPYGVVAHVPVFHCWIAQDSCAIPGRLNWFSTREHAAHAFLVRYRDVYSLIPVCAWCLPGDTGARSTHGMCLFHLAEEEAKMIHKEVA